MKILILVSMLTLAGCGSLNSDYAPNHQSSEQRKPCSCAGMDACSKDAQGNTCCTPDACNCKQITKK